MDDTAKMPAELHNAIGATMTELFRTLGLPAPRFSQRLAIVDAVWRRWHPEIEADPQRAPLIQDAFGDDGRYARGGEQTRLLLDSLSQQLIERSDYDRVYANYAIGGGGAGAGGTHPQSAHGIGLGGDEGESAP